MTAKKTPKSAKTSKEVKSTFLSTFSLSKYIPEKFHILVYALIILALFLFFFSPLYFGGKTFQSGDIITRISANTYLENDNNGDTHYGIHMFLVECQLMLLAVGYKWFNLISVTS